MRETTSFYKGWHLYGTAAWQHGVELRARNNDELRTMIDLRQEPRSPEQTAREILLETWGGNRNLNALQAEWLRGQAEPGEYPLDTALRLVNLRAAYIADGKPKHTAFRTWLAHKLNPSTPA